MFNVRPKTGYVVPEQAVPGFRVDPSDMGPEPGFNVVPDLALVEFPAGGIE